MVGFCFSSQRPWTDFLARSRGVHFNGTQAHSLDAVIEAYRGKIWHYPLYRPLYDSERQRLTQFLMQSIHTPYDEMGAMRSAGSGFPGSSRCFRERGPDQNLLLRMVSLRPIRVVGLHATSQRESVEPKPI